MWLNLAVAVAADDQLRESAGKSRDALISKMTPSQVAEADRMTRERAPKR
jgi:hypothetical protein